MNLRFLITNVLLLLTLITLMQFTFPLFSERELPHWGFHFMYVFLFVLSLTGAAILDRKMKSKPKEFINLFMLISSARMFLSILVIVGLILKAGPTAKYLAVYFVVGYMFFLVAEVIYLFKKSKAKQ